jgi:hypothetical protein
MTRMPMPGQGAMCLRMNPNRCSASYTLRNSALDTDFCGV